MEHAVGILCLITGGNTEAGRRNIGKTVELIKSTLDGGFYFVPETDKVLRLKKGQGWVVKGHNLVDDDLPDYGCYEQRHLMPIKDPDQKTYKVKLTICGHELSSLECLNDS